MSPCFLTISWLLLLPRRFMFWKVFLRCFAGLLSGALISWSDTQTEDPESEQSPSYLIKVQNNRQHNRASYIPKRTGKGRYNPAWNSKLIDLNPFKLGIAPWGFLKWKLVQAMAGISCDLKLFIFLANLVLSCSHRIPRVQKRNLQPR